MRPDSGWLDEDTTTGFARGRVFPFVLTLLRFSLLMLVIGLGTAGLAREALAADWVVDINDVGYDPIPVGGTIVYTISVTNNDLPNAAAAPATVLSFEIPATATFTGGTGTITGCTPTPGTGPTVITCTVPSLPGEAEATLQAQVLTNATGTISVKASVPTSVTINNPPPPVTVEDTAPGNNTAVQQTTVTSAADLSLAVSGPSSAASGSVVNYVFTATNLGPDPATDVTVDIPRPAGLANIAAPPGCVLNVNNYTCSIPGPITANANQSLTFTGQISTVAGSTITVAGTITDSKPGDPTPDNNKALINTAVNAGSDVKITKSRSPSGSLVINDPVTFTLAASYTGESPTGLSIIDVVPSNYQIVSVTPSANSGWTCTTQAQTVSCERAQGNLAGANVSLGTITILATVVQSGNATNEAEITSESPVDPDLTNNKAQDTPATINDESSDLRANKSGPSNPPLVVVGQSYPFPISVTNLGNRPFSGRVIMTDSLPAGLRATSYALNGWQCSPAPPVDGPADIVCFRDYTEQSPLAIGATTPQVVITALVTQSGSVNNTMTVTSENPKYPDPDLGNNTVSVGSGSTAEGDAADIKVVKTAAKAELESGESQTFTIEIINQGPSASADVRLTDDLTDLIDNVQGSGLGNVSTTPANDPNFQCSLNPVGGSGGKSGQLICDLATLPVCNASGTAGDPQLDDCPTVTVTVRPGGNASTRTNSARAVSSTVGDPNLNNNTGSADYEITPQADVTVEKTATPTNPAAGQPLTYIIAAKADPDGRSDADNVTITDTLPNGLIFVSASPSSGSCGTKPAANSLTTSANNKVVCNLGIVPNGGQQTVSILVRPTTALRGSSITNDVDVETSTPGDDLTNNSDNLQTDVGNPALDLQVNKTDDPNVVAVDQDVDYTITARNNGPSDAENVKVVDDLPVNGNVTYVSYTAPADATCSTTTDPQTQIVTTVTCTFPRLTAGASRQIVITMRGEKKGDVVNTVRVSSTETDLGFDTNTRNNTDSEQTTVRNRVDLKITKDTTTPTVEVRQAFTFDITVENLAGARLGEADDVKVTDNLPTGTVLTATPVATAASGVTTLNQCVGAVGATSFTCNFGTVAKGGVITITVPVRVNTVNQSPRVLTNTASVQTSSLDTNSSNNSDPATVTVTSTSVSGMVYRDFNNNGTKDPGDTGISGITMTLTGTATQDSSTVNRSVQTDASGAYSFNFLPAGTYKVTRGTVNEPNLTPGQAIPGQVTATASGATVINNIAPTIAAPVPNNDFTLIPQSSISVVKELLGVKVNSDGSFDASFHLTVTNPSLETLEDITLTDVLSGAVPRFGSYVAANPADGQYTVKTPLTGSCTGLNNSFNGDGDTTVASGFSVGSKADCDVSFTITVNPAPQNNTATYKNDGSVKGTGSLSGQTPENTSNEVNFSPRFSESILLEKSVGTLPPGNTVQPGDPVTYTFKVTNTGNVQLTNITVTDDKVSNIVCTPDVLDPTQSVTCTGDPYLLTAQDIIDGKVINEARVTGQPTTGGSPVLSEDTSTTDLPQFALISLDKQFTGFTDTDGSGAISLGDTLNYTIKATNTGTLPLTDVVVSDSRITPSSETCATLAPGGVCTLTGSLEVNADDVSKGKVTNTATVTSNETDELQDSTTTPVPGTDMEVVSKTPSAEAVALGAAFDFTIVLRNNPGEDPLNPGENLVDAAAVKLSDTLPTGMVLAGGPTAIVDTGTASQNACTGAVGESSFTCDFGLVSVGAGITVTVPVRVVDVSQPPATLTNTATVSTTTRDVRPDNNSNSGTVTVAAAGISGKVYRDFLNNGVFETGDTGIEGVEMTLSGTAEDGSSILLTALTNATGDYLFPNIPVGTYTVTRGAVTESHLVDGQAIPGTTGGTANGALIIEGIPLSDDQVSANNDFTLVPQSRIGIAKRVSSGPTANDNATFDVSFEMVVANLSLEDMNAISVDDVLEGQAPAFGTYAQTLTAPGSYTVTAEPSGTCGGLNGSYNGASSPKLASGFTLAAGATCTVSITIRVLPTDPPPEPQPGGATYLNQATVTGTGSLSGQEATDLSDDGDNPDSNGNGIGNEDGENDPTPITSPIIDPPKLNLTKELKGYDDVDGNGFVSPKDVLHYTVTATNPGPAILEDVVVTDNLITPNRKDCAVLIANESCVLEGSLTVTIDDAQAGKIVNTATARSKQTGPREASVTVEVKPAGAGNNITKQALVTTANRGERVPYVITALDVPIDPARLVDIMPPGFAYLPGSARVNGTAVEPTIDGRVLTFDGLVPDSGNDLKLELVLIVTAGASTGDAVNQAQLVNPENGQVLGSAKARITVLEEAVFDCSDVIGKVFDDKNHNGYQDEGEPGLPGVRIAAVEGLLITTDPFGRFSVACADIPDEDIGSNYILKLDTRTLPTGYRLTTENPRRVRLTRGKVVKLNFGASIMRLVSLDLNAKVFEDGSNALKQKWQAGLGQLVTTLASEPSTLRISYAGKDRALAKARLKAVTTEVERRWKAEGKPYKLTIETVIVAPKGETAQ